MWIRDWNAKHLITAWAVYWAALAGAVAWRPLLEYWRLQRTDGHGEVSLAYSGGLLTLALWVAAPPLVMFVAWLVLRSRARTRESAGDQVR